MTGEQKARVKCREEPDGPALSTVKNVKRQRVWLSEKTESGTASSSGAFPAKTARGMIVPAKPSIASPKECKKRTKKINKHVTEYN